MIFRIGLRALQQCLIPLSFMLVIYIKLHALFQPNGGFIDLCLLKWDKKLIFGFLCLIEPDSYRITTFEPFISR